jgi:hypothetical protein
VSLISIKQSLSVLLSDAVPSPAALADDLMKQSFASEGVFAVSGKHESRWEGRDEVLPAAVLPSSLSRRQEDYINLVCVTRSRSETSKREIY